jgi:hypothetical protein
LSALFKTQTDLFAGAESIGRRLGGGGFGANDANNPQIKPSTVWVKPADLYHPDYREDFAMGDDSYHYDNWQCHKGVAALWQRLLSRTSS